MILSALKMISSLKISPNCFNNSICRLVIPTSSEFKSTVYLPTSFVRGITTDIQQKDYPYFYRVLDSLPENRSLAFAYGSGVFKQAGRAWTNNSMSDFIIATDNPKEWHAENMKINPSHYPPTIRALGPSVVSHLQCNYGAKIYFNTLIPFEDGMIKYGVISTKHLLQDLSGIYDHYIIYLER